MFSCPYRHVTIIYKIPQGYTVEAGPDSIELETEFSTFRASFALTDSVTIQYNRLFEIKAAELPADKYDEYREFLKSVVRIDKSNIVLVRSAPQSF